MPDRHDNTAYQKRISKNLSQKRQTPENLAHIRDYYRDLELRIDRVEVIMPTFDKRLAYIEDEKKELQKELHAVKIKFFYIIGTVSVLALSVIWALYSRLDTKIDNRYDKIVQQYENIKEKIVDKNMNKSTAN